MANHGMKIAQDGFRFDTAADKDLTDSSKFNKLKTKATGNATGSTNVAHGLSYTPIFFTSRTSGGNGSIIGDDPNISCDSTNLIVSSGTIRYYLFYQQGDTS